MKWKEEPLDQCLDRFLVPSKIHRSRFLSSGEFPIMSQESEYINGYWDDAQDVCRLDNPVVLFGDHTQVVKYIDFDFVVGADGVKILKPKTFLEPKYLYYFVMAHRVPSLGYARHYRHIRNIAIRYPQRREQQRIVAVLDEAFEGLDRARIHIETNAHNAQELLSVAIENALQGVGGKSVTLSRLLEDGWILGHLDGNHGSNYPRKDEFVSEGVPYISANCINRNVIDMSRCKFLTPERADVLRKGVAQDRDVIFAHNATVGPVSVRSGRGISAGVSIRPGRF